MHFIYSDQLNKMAKTHTLTTGSRSCITETEILKQLNLFRIILFCVSCSSVGSLYLFLLVYIFDCSISERRHVCMVDVAENRRVYQAVWNRTDHISENQNL